MASYVDYLETLSKKQLMVMLARRRQEETQGIAIVGLGCRFPGGIDDPESFWTALREGRVASMTSDRPPTDSRGRPRWNLDAPDIAPMADLLRPGAYLSNVDVFDAEYFGISEEEASHMDPQQRLALEVAVQALADANLTRAALRGRRMGIFIGAGWVEYPVTAVRNGMELEKISPFTGTGAAPSALPGRLSLMLGVSGPAITVDTASSSVLATLHLAMHALRRRECDIALVGASHLLLSPFSTAMLAKAGMLSPTGRCRPFADDADGHVRAEGCGILVLKRHQDAAADGDQPYALIRGSAVYQYGDRLGLSMASAAGQKAAIEIALRDAGVDPLDVQYVEAQANGSRLGAVIETEAVVGAYDRQSANAPPLYLGSCKANIGYLEHASGAAGLIKTALALAHGEIPPQVGAESLDPDVTRDRPALRFARKPVPWPSGGRRLAGVTAVSFTGIGAHIVLESASDRAEATPPQPSPPDAPALLVLSAHNPVALAATAERLYRHLDRRTDWDHAAVCRTMANGRDHLKARRAAVVHDRDTVLECLARFSDGAPPPVPTRERVGVFLVLPDLGREQLSRALAVSREPGFEPLDHRIRARADKLGVPALDDALAGERGAPQAAVVLAWSLGWIDLLSSAGIEVVGGTFGSPHWRALAAVIAGRSDGDSVCAAWRAGALDALPAIAPGGGWEVTTVAGQMPTLRRSAPLATTPVHPAELDVRRWLELVADRFRMGDDLALAALWTQPRQGMCRLPGPALTGKSYWLDHNNWS